MPRKQQGWITFQSSPEEQQLLEQYSKQSQRSKTEIMRELLRSLNQKSQPLSSQQEREDGRQPSALKVSARNVLKGTVKQVVKGTVNTEVTLEIAPGVELISIITTASAEHLGLEEGKLAYAVIKSSNVMIAGEV